MCDEFIQNENPYASPACTAAAGVDPDGRIYPAIAPADGLDIAIGMTNVALALAVLLGIPFAVAIVLDNVIRIQSPMLLFGIPLFFPAFVWCVSAVSRTVVSVSVDEDGLHFQRRFRSPDDWPWDTINAIRPATRWEVAWHGWIGPLLKPRERTSCMSALGHYRIQGKTDYCFFPPKNAGAFIEAVARHRPELLKL